MIRPAVLESDVDDVLARRLRNDRIFATRFVDSISKEARVRLEFQGIGVDRQARHEGVSGTIDIQIRLLGSNSEVGRLLVENKLDSSFTPNQPERYAISAVAMSKPARPAIAIICAPKKYLARSKYLAPFDASISYETISEWLDGSDKSVVLDAILRFEMPYEPDPVPAVADFHEGYSKLAAQIAPELIVKSNPNPRGERPIDSRTIYFVTSKTLPRWDFLPTLRFSHQCWDKAAPNPSVKIMFGKWGKHEGIIRRAAVGVFGNSRMYIRKAGDSLGLVIDTPKLDNTRPVSQQFDAVSRGIRAAATLRAWMYGNEEKIKDWADIVSAAR